MATDNIPGRTSLAATITAVATVVTAIGGLVYAFKSNNLSAENKKEVPKTMVAAKTERTEKILNGKVGKLEATFNLSFNDQSGAVTGIYYYDKRQDELYDLSGTFAGTDLHLQEFTKGVLSAKCLLKLDENGCYSGKMFNTDGRVFTMNICE